MIFKLIKKLFDKYNSLRQEAWTHWLVLVTYLFAIPTISLYIYLLPDTTGSGEIFALYLFFSIPIFSGLAGFALIMGFYNQFQKSKIKNKFLTQNKIYWIYWTIGNILFLWFVGFYIKHC